MDTVGTKIFVLISEVFLFQGENNICIYIKLEQDCPPARHIVSGYRGGCTLPPDDGW